MRRTFISLYSMVVTVVSVCSAAQVQEVKVPSASMGVEIPATVVLPDSYAKSMKAYPVVYLLHGYSSNHSSVLKFATDVLTTAADTYNMIVFLPDGGYNSWYFDSPVQPEKKYETHISGEVIAFVDSRYRTIAAARGRAITGGSMGGHGAMFVGLRHKELFAAVGTMSGAVDFRPWPDGWDIKQVLGPKELFPQRWDEFVVVNNLNGLKPGELTVYVDVGTEDAFLEVNRALHRKLLEMGIGHIYVERPGHHDNPYWREAIKYQLFCLHQVFRSSLLPEEIPAKETPSSCPSSIWIMIIFLLSVLAMPSICP
jgi:S-formylglutathione hydrolase FrmB